MALKNNPTQLEVVKAIKDLEGRAIIELEENGSTTAGTWLAKTDKITALEDGQLFLYKIAVAGASSTTLNITANGTALGAIRIYRVGTTALTTQYGVGQYLLLIYNTTNSCFRVVNDYDANSYAYVRQYQAGSNAAGSGTKYPILTRYNLTNKNGTYDTAYSRYHTGVTIDTSNGNLNAPTISENGTALSNKYQPTLVSGTNIKTINGNSLLGSGDLEVGGGSATDVQVNGTSITSGGVANIVTESAYNASTNKIATKNDITKANAGLSNVANERQYSANNPPPYPVTSVNGQKGAVTGLATSNPNLLINSNFAINQRNGYIFRGTAPFYSDAGLTNQIGYTDARVGYVTVEEISGNAANITISYTPDNGSSWITQNGYVSLSSCTSGYVGSGYGVDRWKIIAGTFNSTNKTLVSTAAWQGIIQYIEDWQPLKGQTVTASIKATSGASGIRFGLKNANTDLTYVDGLVNTSGILSVSFTIPSNANYTNFNVAIWNKGAETTTFEWVKLEVGDVATEYTPPLMAEELLKCQRYYQKFIAYNQYHSFCLGIAYNSATQVIAPLKYNVEMRALPTISYGGKFRLFGNAYKTDITIGQQFMSRTICPLVITTATGGLTKNAPYILSANGDNGAFIAFDAEL